MVKMNDIIINCILDGRFITQLFFERAERCHSNAEKQNANAV